MKRAFQDLPINAKRLVHRAEILLREGRADGYARAVTQANDEYGTSESERQEALGFLGTDVWGADRAQAHRILLSALREGIPAAAVNHVDVTGQAPEVSP